MKSLNNFKSLSKINARSTNIQKNCSGPNTTTTDSCSSTGSKHSKNSKKLFGILKNKSKMGNSIILDDKLRSINENEAVPNSNTQIIPGTDNCNVRASLSMLLSYDTTLIPYLKELFAKELEDELNEVGSIENSGLFPIIQEVNYNKYIYIIFFYFLFFI